MADEPRDLAATNDGLPTGEGRSAGGRPMTLWSQGPDESDVEFERRMDRLRAKLHEQDAEAPDERPVADGRSSDGEPGRGGRQTPVAVMDVAAVDASLPGLPTEATGDGPALEARIDDLAAGVRDLEASVVARMIVIEEARARTSRMAVIGLVVAVVAVVLAVIAIGLGLR